MKSKTKRLIKYVLILSLWLVAGCTPGAKAEPTQDALAVYTMAAQTVQAQLTQTALSMPTLTATSLPTDTPEAPATATNVPPTVAPPTLPPLTTGTPQLSLTPKVTLPPSAPTFTPITQKTGDSAVFGSQSPADGAILGGNQDFVLLWSFLNNGTTTWTVDYRLIFISGTQLSSVTIIPCGRDGVRPFETCDFYLAARTPLDPGKYITRFKLVNPQGIYLTEVYFAFVVQ